MLPRLILQFLGLPQVLLDDRPISTDRRKAIALLAYLAVNDVGRARQRYSRESLSALLWPDFEQARAFSSLRTTLWKLRQILGDSWLIAERESVQLNPNAEIILDVARFRELLSQGRQQTDPAFRIPLSSDAVKLYRDHFLTGFSLKDAPNFNEWAFAESEDLRRKLAEALSMLSEDHCALGQADQAIPYARRLVALDPLNESSHRQLMEVYWQAGQHSAALKQYQTCEQILRKELNLDPQPETRALYKKILKGEVKPTHIEKQTEAVLPKNNLPLQLSSFIGREKEQDEIVNLAKKNRLISLVGTGGIGKSRLSIQAGFALLNEFPNGTWLIELAPLSDPALVAQAIVNTLGLLEQAGRSHLSILTDFLQNKRTLLILDNCEHLIQACAELAETLLRACPELHILATSREALSIAGEAVYLVPSLTTPDPLKSTLGTLSQYEAVQLFLERAQSAVRDFSLTQGNAHAIAQVCHHLDGIPLALELAAARVRGLSVEQIASRLDDRFHLLTGGARTVLPRHQTLQAMIDWSYDLLSESERTLLCRLSVFAGGWTLEAAEAVCAGDGLESDEILDLLLRLVDKSLVIAETQGAEPRYDMLETIGQYAREKLWQTGEGELLRQGHLAYFVELAERAEPNLRAFGMIEWLNRLEAELDNIRIAMEYALESDIEVQLRMASALLWFWWIRDYRLEGIGWLERALSIEAMERGSKPLLPARAMLRAQACYAAGSLATWWSPLMREKDHAASLLEESLALFWELGLAGRRGMAYTILSLRGAVSLQGDFDRARSLIEDSLILFREMGDKFGIAECMAGLGAIALEEGNIPQARVRFEEHLTLSKEFGDKDGIAACLFQLGYLAAQEGDYQRGLSLCEESLAIARELGSRATIAYQLERFAFIVSAQSQVRRAARLLGAAYGLRESINSPIPAHERAEYDREVTALRAQMDEAAFAAIWAEGQAMTLEEAIAYARNDD
jgi:predicted ATPase/DNA-binding SARP family transcriptional activator